MRLIKSATDFPSNGTIRTGFVPTMGALHEGHLSLIRRSKAENDRTIVSVFVNPTQFAPTEDFNAYPRPIERDCELATNAGADIIFNPEVDAIYGENPAIIHVPYVTELFEGAARPGHFDGVATVVAKLFNIVSPKNVYFGEKDLQQCTVIRKMVEDFNFPINIIICPTIREDDGLAKSSRNVYLSAEERDNASALYQTLFESKTRINLGELPEKVLADGIDSLTKKSFRVDYFELVNRDSMHPILEPNDKASLIVAAKIGSTRLIDNLRIVG